MGVLFLASDPEPLRDGNGWGCLYLANLNGERAIGSAWTPPGEINFAQQLRFLPVTP